MVARRDQQQRGGVRADAVRGEQARGTGGDEGDDELVQAILPPEMPDPVSALMKQCSRHLARTTSQQRTALPVTGRGTVFSQDSRPGGQQCSPAGGHQLTSLPDGEPANTH